MRDLVSAYTQWRGSEIGRIVERLESDLVFELAGPLSGKKLLDAGCGAGTYTVEAARLGAAATGIDTSPEMISAARKGSVGSGAVFVEGDITELPFPDGSVDVILAVTVLCVAANPGSALREISRVMKPGGKAVIGELQTGNTWALTRRIRGRFGDPVWKQVHFWSRRELIRLVESAGLRPVELRGAIFFPRWTLIARIAEAFDLARGRRTTRGAAFLAVSAVKPEAATR